MRELNPLLLQILISSAEKYYRGGFLVSTEGATQMDTVLSNYN